MEEKFIEYQAKWKDSVYRSNTKKAIARKSTLDKQEDYPIDDKIKVDPTWFNFMVIVVPALTLVALQIVKYQVDDRIQRLSKFVYE